MAKDILHTRNVLLRCMCAIYMSAFCSLYLQIPGLYGEKGILPGHSMIGDKKSVKECIMQKKTLLCSMSLLGLNTSYMMELIALTGTALSFIGLIWKKWCTTFLFAILWMLYLSLYKVGQTFLWFQWDSLLLEVGFLTIVVAPFTWSSWTEYKPRNLVTMWLVRWALFRLMFASGVVKLQSGCPTWWGLTALNVHYESQCIPTPLAWFVHHSPDWIHKLAVASTLALEIAVPFFFFSPIRAHRLFAFYTQVVFQLCIVLTGNYNFFNLLTMLLCLSLLDDVHLGYRSVRDLSSGFIANVKGVLNWAAKWTGYAVLTYYLLAYFSIKLSPNGEIEATISFTRENFAFWVSKAVPLSITIGAFSLLITVAEALTSCVFEVKGVVRKAAAFFTTLAYSFVVISLFGISLVPYTVLHPQTRQTVWPVLKQWHARSSDLEITSSYGLFRHMTGVGGRPEVILEGANKLEGPWIEYEFPSKPGRVDRAPPFIVPHQPRVDWQLWFAALGSYTQNPWFVSMAHKFLAGEKEVLNFLDRSSPWRQKPPKYIRALKYFYHYTSLNDTSGNWWRRELEGEYMPTYSVNHGPLLDYLRSQQLLDTKDVRVKNQILAHFLDAVREMSNVLENHLTIYSLFIAAFLILFTKSRLF